MIKDTLATLGFTSILYGLAGTAYLPLVGITLIFVFLRRMF